MEHRPLGRSALRVSELCLGTMNFGPATPEDDAFRILDRALDLGIDFIDTADQYGGRCGVGATEEILGRWLAQGGGRRDRVVLATKVYEPMSDYPNDRGLSARHIRLACEASLRRLQVEHIDLYQMHHLDRSAPWEEIWQAMDMLVAQGKVIYIGSSNFPGWTIARANEIAGNRNSFGLVSEQSLYNLTQRSVELEVIPACEAYGVGLLPWSPVAGGLLAGADAADASGRRATADAQRRIDDMRPQLERWERLCIELGHPPSAVALAWLMHQPAVTAPIIGPRTMEHLESSVRATRIQLDATALAELDDIFPGQGPAPEAYAW